MTEFLARVGDRINPIVVKETRQAVSSRLVASFLLLFLAVQLIMMLLMMTGREMADPDDLNLRAGRDLFTFVQGILLGTCLILIPTMTGARLASERSDVNVDLLFISSLTPRAVLSGKLFAAAALALLIFSACAPFMTFAYVMRGLDVPTIFVVLVADFLMVLTATAFALFLASVPANRVLRVFLGVAGFGVMCWFGAGLLALSAEFLRGGSEFDPGSGEFWAGFLGLALLVVGFLGLFFVWSVALISPAAANRALAVRAYTLFFWFATFVGFGAFSLYIKSPEPMAVWGVFGTVLFALQIVVGSCERDEWGTRVARRIPKPPLLRAPAFFFYSGSAGGIAFGAIGSVLSVLGMLGWYVVVPSARSFDRELQPVIFAGLFAGYTYCYSMTSVGARRLFDKSVFPSGYTWVLGALLFGLGCVIPFFIRFVFFESRSRYGYNDEFAWLYLPNPFATIPDVLRDRGTGLGLTIFFLAAWAGLVTIVNVPWFIRQMVNFKPPGPVRADDWDDGDDGDDE